MEQDAKNKMIKEKLKKLAKSSNDTTLIEDNIRELMKNKVSIKSLIYYLYKCNPIMLLKIKSNLEIYKDIIKFRRSMLFPNVVVYISILISLVPVIMHYFREYDKTAFVFIVIVLIGVGIMLHFAEKFLYTKKIVMLENYIESFINLVNYILEINKGEIKKYFETICKKDGIEGNIKKAPVKNTSAEK